MIVNQMQMDDQENNMNNANMIAVPPNVIGNAHEQQQPEWKEAPRKSLGSREELKEKAKPKRGDVVMSASISPDKSGRKSAGKKSDYSPNVQAMSQLNIHSRPKRGDRKFND